MAFDHDFVKRVADKAAINLRARHKFDSAIWTAINDLYREKDGRGELFKEVATELQVRAQARNRALARERRDPQMKFDFLAQHKTPEDEFNEIAEKDFNEWCKRNGIL